METCEVPLWVIVHGSFRIAQGPDMRRHGVAALKPRIVYLVEGGVDVDSSL